MASITTTLNDVIGPAVGQGWREVGDLAAAFALCSLISLEREVRRKSANPRTHGLIILGAALFVLKQVTAAVGAACGAGLLLLGAAVTAGHYIAAVVYPFVVRRRSSERE